MSQPIVVVVHGMGEHTSDSFKKEVEEPLDKASARFASIKKFSEAFDVISIAYDEVWNEVRKALASDANSISTKLSGIKDVGNLAAIASKLTSIGAKFNDDKFLYTHVLDVILYKTFYGERTRVHVAKQLGKAIKKANDIGQPLHVIAHSLGTAVIHDVLHKIFENEHTDELPSDLGVDFAQIDPLEKRINSLYMVANVSRVVDGTVDAHNSAVRPGQNKLCRQMINIHHQFDPFTLVKPFSRGPDDNWASKYVWDRDLYRDIAFNDVADVNVHDIKHYLDHPKVYSDIFNTIYNSFSPTNQEKSDADAAYQGTTVDGKFDIARDAADDINWTKPETVKEFWEALAAFYKKLEELKTLGE